MKKFVSALLVAVLLAGMLPVMAPAVAEDSYAVVNSGNEFGVRLRLGPGTTYDIMNTLPTGTTVTILETGTVWSRIQAGTQVGYMMSKFLVTGGTTSSFTVQSTATVYAGNGLRTWLRSSANGKRLGLYSDGTPVSVISKGDTWSKIMIGSSVGYMMTKYLKFGGSSSAAPAAPVTPVISDITDMRLNYPYPLVGDTLKPIITPANATCLYAWEVLNDDGSVLRSLGSNPVCTVGKDLLGYKIRLTITGTGDCEGQILTAISQPVTEGEELTGVMIRNSSAPESTAPAIGDVLEAVTAPSSANVTYSWRVSGEEKSTGSTYTVTEADKGKKIQLYVKAESPFTGEAVSAYTGKVTKAPEITAVVLSTDSPVVGKAITVSPVPSTVSATYTWYVDGVAKTTAAKYTPTARDLGKKITVKAVDTNGISAIGEAEQPVSEALITSVSINNASPAVGEVITASVKPGAASRFGNVVYTWYVDDVPVSSSPRYNQYEVSAADEGKRIYVVAEGDGTYGGKVTSGVTNPVTEMTKLLGVKLDNSKPVIGSTLTATVTPSSANDTGKLVFVWYKDNVPFATTADAESPAMTEQEVGRKISVRVSGSSPYYGEVESTQTAAVLGKGKVALSGLQVTCSGGTQLATKYHPRIGESLTATVTPDSAVDKVEYVWYLGDEQLHHGRTYVVPEKTPKGTSTAGKTLTIWAVDEKNHIYTGRLKVVTATIYAPAKGDKPLNIDLTLITPKAGELPVSSISGDNYTATIKWDAPMDSFGRFKKGTEYTATVTVKPASKYYIDETKIEAPGSDSFLQFDLTTIKATYSVASDAPVSIYSITGLEAPMVGATPDNSINSTSQFTGYSVKWVDENGDAVSTFKAGEIYTAEITIEKLEGYTFDTDTIANGVNTTLFSVAGANKAILTSADSDRAVITATFDAASTETKVLLSVDRSSVGVGSSAKLVQCEAYLTNYAGEQSDLKWTWTVDGATSDETKISNTGLLTIGKDEKQGSSLRVTASIKLDGKTYDASAAIATTAEGDVDGSTITVSFVTFPGSVDAGGTASFAARVDGAKDETILWSINSTVSSITSAGVLTVSEDETADVITVTATSKAYPDKTAVAGIRIIYPDAVAEPSLSFTSTVSTAAPGSQVKIAADITSPDVTDYLKNIKFVAGGDAEISLKNNGDGTCTITVGSDAKDGDVVTVSASYVTSAGKTLSISTNFVVVVPETDMVAITPTSANLYQGQKYTLTAETTDGSAVKWSSEDETIATVDPDTGVVTASESNTGSVKIIATSELSGAKAEATITVSYKREMEVSGDSSFATSNFNGFDTIPDVTWSTSDSSVATIDASGNITTYPGEVEQTVSIIGTAEYEGITYSDSYTITVSPNLGAE